MKVGLDHKVLVKYPFLKESQDLVRGHTESLDRFLSGNPGKSAVSRAKDRVENALSSKKQFDESDPGRLPPELEIASYAIARILISCTKERALIERFAQYEAERMFFYLQMEEPRIKRYVAQSAGTDPDASEVPVVKYIELAAQMRDDRWRLVNRDIVHGYVKVEAGEHDELLRECIRALIRHDLPLRVPAAICESLTPVTEQILTRFQERILEQFGEIDEGSFPPCIHALITAITAGTNLPHTGRFAITAFLHIIGMDTTTIVEIYSRAPDFDIEKTMYQVEHITGRGGTEYVPPSCATMRTYGLCTNRNKLCDTVSHPLTYYKIRKKRGKTPGESVTPPSH